MPINAAHTITADTKPPRFGYINPYSQLARAVAAGLDEATDELTRIMHEQRSKLRRQHYLLRLVQRNMCGDT